MPMPLSYRSDVDGSELWSQGSRSPHKSIAVGTRGSFARRADTDTRSIAGMVTQLTL
jgi:hypothetical protein